MLDPPTDLERYYEGDYYRHPSLADLDRVAAKERYQVEIVKTYVSGGRLVEIGAAWGVFCRGASQAGFEVVAVERDAACCEYLEEVVGVDVIATDQPEIALARIESVDAVVMWQVIEHLPDPWSVLGAAAERLRADGILVVATPNPKSLGFRLSGASWPHLDAPRHLWLLPVDVLIERAAAAGLTLVGLSFDDHGSRSWNRFAWQRLLMNRVRSRLLQRVAYVVGYGLSALVAPLERRGRNSSSYTAIFQKAVVR